MALLQTEVQTPHFSMPFRFGGLNGGVMMNEQDTSDDVVDCIKAIIAYPVGSREDSPDFGCADLLFHQNANAVTIALQNAILLWEPRAETIIDELDDFDEFVQQLRLSVSTRDE